MALMTRNPVAPMSRADAQRIIHGYTLWELLGSGSYGDVYKATAPGGRPAAVKIIKRGRRAAAELELDALEAIKHLDHPHLLKVFAAFIDPDEVVMVTELASGTLRDRLKVCRTPQPPSAFPVDELLHYMRQGARALDYLHGEGKVHRDVKPDNFLLFNGKEPYIKLGDCGLVREYSEQNQEMTLQGTPAYIPPEVWGRRGGARSDQYSLAVTYAELRRGTRPFADSTPFGLMAAHQTLKPDLTGLDPAEQAIVARALAKDPGGRFPSCLAFVEQLEAVFTVRPDSWRPGRPVELPQTKEPRESPEPSPAVTSGLASPPPPAVPTAPPAPERPVPPPTLTQAPLETPWTDVPRRPPTSPGMPPVSAVPAGLSRTILPQGEEAGPSRTIMPGAAEVPPPAFPHGSTFDVDLGKYPEYTEKPAILPPPHPPVKPEPGFPLLKAVLAVGLLVVVGVVGVVGYVAWSNRDTRDPGAKKDDAKGKDDDKKKGTGQPPVEGTVTLTLPAEPLWVAADGNNSAEWKAEVKDAGPVQVTFDAAPRGLELSAEPAEGGSRVVVRVKAPAGTPPGVYRVGFKVAAEGARTRAVKRQDRDAERHVDVHVFPPGFRPQADAAFADGYYPRLARDVGGQPVVLCLLRPREGQPFYLMQNKLTNGVYGHIAGKAPPGGPLVPALGVTWEQAQQCARRLGGDLPTPQQYDRAARPPGGNGDGPYRGTRVAVNRRKEGACAVNDPADADNVTTEGVRGLAGNGREWTRQELRSEGGRRLMVLRGRSFTAKEPLSYKLIAEQRRPDLVPTQYADHASPTTGFRVAFEFPNH